MTWKLDKDSFFPDPGCTTQGRISAVYAEETPDEFRYHSSVVLDIPETITSMLADAEAARQAYLANQAAIQEALQS